jgi:hypothetical protein
MNLRARSSNKKENDKNVSQVGKQNQIIRGGRPIKFYPMEDLLHSYFQGQVAHTITK